MSYNSDDDDGAPMQADIKPHFDPNKELPQDFEVRLLKGLVKRLLTRIEDPMVEVSVAEMTLIRQLAESNSVSFSSIKRGDFGQLAQRTAEEFPFQMGNREEGAPLQ